MFHPDSFSNPDIQFTRAMDASFFDAVIENYFPNSEVLFTLQHDGNEINSGNYKVTLTLSNKEQKEVLVHEYKTLQDEKQIEANLHFLTQLWTKSVKVSMVCKTKDGHLFLKLNGKIYTVFEFIDATHFPAIEEALASVAHEVASLHKAFSEFPSVTLEEFTKLSRNADTFFNHVLQVSAREFEEIQRALSSIPDQTEIDLQIRQKMPQYIQAAQEIEASRQRMQSYPSQLFHSDLHPHNILMHKNKNEVAAIIDFDSTRVQPLGHALDVAYAIYRLGRQFFVGKELQLQEIQKQAKKLRELFITSYIEVKPLSEQEIELLPILVKEEMMKKLLYLLKGAYVGNNSLWSHEIAKFAYAIDEINCFWE